MVLQVFIFIILLLQGCAGDEDQRSRSSVAQSDQTTQRSGDEKDHGGDGTENRSYEMSASFEAVEQATDRVDVVVVVENGSSGYRTQITDGMKSLMGASSTYPKGRFTVITASSNSASACLSPSGSSEIRYYFSALETPPKDIRHINCGVDSMSGLASLTEFFKNKHLASVSFDKVFRPQAIKAFVVVSGEGAADNHAAQFSAAAEALWDVALVRFFHFSVLKADAHDVSAIASSRDIARRFPWVAVQDRSFLIHRSNRGSSDNYSAAYSTLQEQYSGKGFSLANSGGWASALGGIAGTLKYAQRTYDLELWRGLKGLSIASVTLAGQQLKKSQYTLGLNGEVPVLALADQVSVNVGDQLIINRQ